MILCYNDNDNDDNDNDNDNDNDDGLKTHMMIVITNKVVNQPIFPMLLQLQHHCLIVTRLLLKEMIVVPLFFVYMAPACTILYKCI